jgi:hypothetical protein
MKRDTDFQVHSFKKLQTEVERQIQPRNGNTVEKSSDWEFSGKKRKKVEDKGGLKGIKLRKTTSDAAKSSSKETIPVENGVKVSDIASKDPDIGDDTASELKPSSTSLGLAGYSSDED